MCIRFGEGVCIPTRERGNEERQQAQREDSGAGAVPEATTIDSTNYQHNGRLLNPILQLPAEPALHV